MLIVAFASSSRSARRDTRRVILDAAIDCIARDGFEAASLEAIAEAAGVTRPALYYHYAGRRELILAVMVESGGRVVEQIRREASFQAATLDLVVTCSARMVELSVADPVCRQLATPAGEHLMAELLRSEEMLAIQHGFWVPLLTAAIEAGEVRDDIDLDEIITWLIFLQLSLANVGSDFGLLGQGRVRNTLERFLGPALAAQ